MPAMTVRARPISLTRSASTRVVMCTPRRGQACKQFSSALPRTSKTSGAMMQGFKSIPSAERFLTTHAAIDNAFDLQRHMISRPMLRLFRTRAESVWAKATA